MTPVDMLFQLARSQLSGPARTPGGGKSLFFALTLEVQTLRGQKKVEAVR